MKWSISLLLLAYAAPAYCTDATDLLQLVPPDARIVFGAHIHAVLDSSLARGITAQMKLTSADMPKFVPIFGFDPLTDLDEVLISSSGEGNNPPMMVLAHGTFDLTQLNSKGKLYHGVRLIVTENKNEENGFAFLDATTVVLGELAEVKAVIDRRISKRVFDQVRWAQLAGYRDHYAVWGVAERPSSLVKKLPAYSASPALDAIDKIQFGLAFTKGLEFAAELHPRTADDVAQLTDSLKLLETMVKASRPSLNDGTSIDIETADNGTMKLSFAISEEQLARAIQNQKPAEVAVAATTEPVHRETANRKVRPAPPVDHSQDGGTTVFTLPGRR